VSDASSGWPLIGGTAALRCAKLRPAAIRPLDD
jgi:hypothetical protein